MPNQNETNIVNAEKPRRLRGLLFLNVALLVVLAVVTFSPNVRAQSRGRGEYTMVAGSVQGTDAPVVWIVDVANQEMIAMMYNPNTKTLEGLDYRNLAGDAAAIQRGRSRPIP